MRTSNRQHREVLQNGTDQFCGQIPNVSKNVLLSSSSTVNIPNQYVFAVVFNVLL